MTTRSQITKAVDALKRGEVLAVATDTVYGLVCDPRNAAAVARIFSLKARSQAHPLQMLAISADQAGSLIAIPERAQDLTQHWPGALTIIAPAKKGFVPGIGEHDGDKQLKIGVRVPSSESIVELLRAFGPLAATSANISGKPSALTAAEVRSAFGTKVAHIIGTDDEVQSGVSSTVVDVTHVPFKILRQGTVRISHA